jgi:hypothetical protein
MTRRIAAIAIACLAVAACASTAPTGVPAAGSAVSGTPPAFGATASPGTGAASEAPSSAVDADGRYTLSFALPKASFRTDEAITGHATLTLEPGPDAPVGGSGSLIGFGFAEVGGTRRMGPIDDLVCRFYTLTAGTPVTSDLVKSGGWTGEDPDASFYASFFHDTAIKLPAGDWDITASASFSDGNRCTNAPHDLKATVRVHIVDAAASVTP